MPEYKKMSGHPFVVFATRDLREQYSALPNGSIVENFGNAQKYVCDLAEIEECGFRTTPHEIQIETRNMRYPSVLLVAADDTPMKQQVLGLLYFHKNMKTHFQSDAEKWLQMMRDGVRVFLTDNGFTTVDPQKAKRVAIAKEKAALHKKSSKQKAAPTATAPAQPMEVKKFTPAPPPKVNAWAKPLNFKPAATDDDAASDDAATDDDAASDDAASDVGASDESGLSDIEEEDDHIVEEPVHLVEGSDEDYTTGWKTVGNNQPVKKAPKYFICMERGFRLKVVYNDTGRPSIVQVSEDGESTTSIGWTKEMTASGFKHMKTPEGHHIFFKSSHLKVPLMAQCLDYTAKNSTDQALVARAKEVLTWKKKFIVKNADGELVWAQSFKETPSERPSVAPANTADEFPELVST
jgi:hypothetical protein